MCQKKTSGRTGPAGPVPETDKSSTRDSLILQELSRAVGRSTFTPDDSAELMRHASDPLQLRNHLHGTPANGDPIRSISVGPHVLLASRVSSAGSSPEGAHGRFLRSSDLVHQSIVPEAFQPTELDFLSAFDEQCSEEPTFERSDRRSYCSSWRLQILAILTCVVLVFSLALCMA